MGIITIFKLSTLERIGVLNKLSEMSVPKKILSILPSATNKDMKEVEIQDVESKHNPLSPTSANMDPSKLLDEIENMWPTTLRESVSKNNRRFGSDIFKSVYRSNKLSRLETQDSFNNTGKHTSLYVNKTLKQR